MKKRKSVVTGVKITILAIICLITLMGCSTWQVEHKSRIVSRHELFYSEPATVWDEAFPLGNGFLGGLVWGDGEPLKISLDRTDLWDLRPVPEWDLPEYNYQTMRQWIKEGRSSDVRRLYEKPYEKYAGPTKLPAGRIELNLQGQGNFENANLQLSDAMASMKFKNANSQIFISAKEQIGFIRITDTTAVTPKLVVPKFSAEKVDESNETSLNIDLAKLGYNRPDIKQGDNWQAYRQECWGGFAFSVALMYKQTSAGWVGVWSIATSNESDEPLKAALANCRKGLKKGFDKAYAEHKKWWDGYWSRMSVSLPNDLLERQYYLDMYKFGAAARPDTPPITLQGPWTADNGKLPPWRGDYHHDLNTELSYWPAYAGNSLDLESGFIKWLWETKSNARAWTKKFFGLPGLNVPMTSDLAQNQMGGWAPYTHSATTAAWLAHHFYLHWRYSMDRNFLETRAYPWLQETSVFLKAITEMGPDGKRTLPLSSSPEINDNRLTAWFKTITNYDLALIRWTFEKTAELADELGKKDEAAYWRDRLAEMPELAIDPDSHKLLVAKDYPLQFSHRHFSHLMAIHPLGLIEWDNGIEDQKVIEASLTDLENLGTKQWTGYSFSWLANFWARAKNSQKAEEALEIFSKAFCLRNSFHCNGDQSGKGYSSFTYRPFTLEGNFAAAAAIQEMLLQSHTGTIRIFPAIPEDWKDVSFETLRAQGAFLISAERKNGQTIRVEIASEKGGVCRLANPFGTKSYDYKCPGSASVVTDGNTIIIKTKPGQKIVLMRKM